MRTRTVVAGLGLAAIGTLIGRRVALLRPVEPALRKPITLLPIDVGNRVWFRVLRNARDPAAAPPQRRADAHDPAAGLAGGDRVPRTSRKRGRTLGRRAALDPRRRLRASAAPRMDDALLPPGRRRARRRSWSSVDYRLAPEHPFPARARRLLRRARWLHEHAAERGVDPARIAIGGASAGGGLAAALAHARARRAACRVAVQLLMYPMLDDRTVAARATTTAAALRLWTPPSNRFGWTALPRAPRRARTTSRRTPRRAPRAT